MSEENELPSGALHPSRGIVGPDLSRPSPIYRPVLVNPPKERRPPSGWVWTTIGEVAAINPRVNISTMPDSTLISFVPMASVEAGTGHIDTSTQRLLSEVKRGYTAFLEGDVLFAKITPCMENGKSAVARSLSSGIGFGSTEFHVLRPLAYIDPQLLYYYVSQASFRQTARTFMTGSAGQLRVPTAFLIDVPFPLPPLPEQHRIVAAIEQQFSRLDAAVAALRQAQAKLKRYRAAVLKAAVEGKLTEAWRAEHPTTEPASSLLERILAERRTKWEADLRAKGKDPAKVRYVDPGKPNMESLPELPEGWCWTSLEVVSSIQLGKMLSPKAYERDLLQLPYLRNENVRWGSIDYSDVKMMGFKASELEKYRLEPYDLLICEGGEAGRCAVYTDSAGQFMYQKALHRVRVASKAVDPYFIQFCLQHYVTSKIVIPKPSETTIQHLPLEKIRILPLPLLSLVEQEQIVAEVDRRLSVISQLEATVAANLKRAERLRQSILKEAFAGRLVPQDPSDEPANILLERIRKERDQQKNGAVNKGRVVSVAEPMKIDVRETKQVELWEGVGG